MKVVNASSGKVLGTDVRLARSFLSRGLGLMGRRALEPGEGLVIPSCRAITTFFMRIPIDVIFIDMHGRVVGIIEGLRPWRNVFGPLGTSTVLELPAGVVRGSGTQVGHMLELLE